MFVTHEEILELFAEASRLGHHRFLGDGFLVRYRDPVERFDDRPFELQAAELEAKRAARMAEERQTPCARKYKPRVGAALARWQDARREWRKRDAARMKAERAQRAAEKPALWRAIESMNAARLAREAGR